MGYLLVMCNNFGISNYNYGFRLTCVQLWVRTVLGFDFVSNYVSKLNWVLALDLIFESNYGSKLNLPLISDLLMDQNKL